MRIAVVKRVDRRRMDKLMEEFGVQVSLTGRLVKAGHLVKMGEERMAKRAERYEEKR